MRPMLIVQILGVAALVLLAGCNGDTQTIDASTGAPRQSMQFIDLVAAAQPPIPDFPIPMGFKLDEGKSRDYALAGARLVDHVYKGGSDKLAVKRFYERQMPINRWVLSTAMFVRGDVMLDFEKATERCRIIIGDGGLFSATSIKVQLWTSGRLETPAVEEQTTSQ